MPNRVPCGFRFLGRFSKEYDECMKYHDFLKLLVSLTVAQSAGVLGSFFTVPSIPAWYAGLAKPSFAPPNWVFGPVWTMLFLLMGVAAYLVWRKGLEKREVRVGLTLFVAQLALNMLWSALFFGLRNPGAALVEIVVLWSAILATAIVFKKVSRPAGLLLLPYLLWVAFAAYLNYAIWKLN